MNPMIDLLLAVARILASLHPDLAPKIGAVETMIEEFGKEYDRPEYDRPGSDSGAKVSETSADVGARATLVLAAGSAELTAAAAAADGQADGSGLDPNAKPEAVVQADPALQADAAGQGAAAAQE